MGDVVDKILEILDTVAIPVEVPNRTKPKIQCFLFLCTAHVDTNRNTLMSRIQI